MLTEKGVSGWHAAMLGETKNPEARYPEARKQPADFEETKGQRRSQQSPRARAGLQSQQAASNGEKNNAFPGLE